MTPIRTTCPYCGVGCGLVVQTPTDIAGDPTHPANHGRLCSKGAALARTLDDSERLTVPLLHGRAVSWDAALDRVASQFNATIAAHGPDSVAFYVSGQFLTEDYYAANKLMKGCIGSGNIDTNSRLCMASSVAGHVRAFGEDLVPGVYEDWDEADLFVLVGSNAAWCHPVLHQRLLAARRSRGARVVVLDPRRTATAEAADLHLPLAPDTDVGLFNGLLVHLQRAGCLDRTWLDRCATGFDAALAAALEDAPDPDAVGAICGIDPEAVETFYDWFARTERVLTVWSQGVNQSEAGTDKVNAIINCHLATGRIGRPGMGPFSVTGQPNAMGGREVGGLASQLAAHLRMDAADCDRLRRFWRVPRVASRPGLKAVELFDAVLDGRVKAIWIAGTNPAASMPRADRVRRALAACPFVVVADCWPTDTTAYADVVLPAAGWGEKDGTVTNSERRISRQRAFRSPPGAAQPDWWMFAEAGGRMGFAAQFPWDSAADVFREHAALSGFENHDSRVFDISGLAGLNDDAYAALPPVRWPLPAGSRGEGGRLFGMGGFPTADGRAQLVPVRAGGWADREGKGLPLPLWEGVGGSGQNVPLDPSPHPPRTRGGGDPSLTPTDPAPPIFILNTGRVRDQWHTMTRTGAVASLMAHTPEPRLAIHPADAARIGLEQNALAWVETEDGATLLRANLHHGQRRGEVFAPMHWTDAFASAGPIARSVTGRTDPHSGQPALKSSRASVTPVQAGFHGLLLRRHGGALPRTMYWARTPVETGQLYRLTGFDGAPGDDALTDLLHALIPDEPGQECLVLRDPARQVLRAAALTDGRLRAALFLAPDPSGLPQPDAIVPLLDSVIPDAARAGLLSGRATVPTDTGPHVCACFGVARGAVRHAVVTHRLDSVAAIGRHLRAGTNCGSCIPELEEILRDVRVPA
jgi:assimilatory nitrate reductase catalytic subunit